MTSEKGCAVSVTGATYDRLRAHSVSAGVSMRQLVAELVAELDSLTQEQVRELADRVRQQSEAMRGRPSAAAIALRARWDQAAEHGRQRRLQSLR